MKELQIKHKLDITSNMEELSNSIKKDIDTKYNVIVTSESVADSKKLMASINKEKSDFKSTYKSFKEKVLEPFKELDIKAKQIESFYDDAREALKNQVEQFETKRLEISKEVCFSYLHLVCEEKKINSNSININDLCSNLGSATVAGKISAKAKGEIDSRVQYVENEILKAKLAAEEKAKRDREIAEQARIEAEKKALEREARLKVEAQENEARLKLQAQQREERLLREAKEREEKAKQEAIQREELLKKQIEEKPAIIENPKPEIMKGKKRVVLTFEFEVKGNPKDSDILAKVKDQITDVFKQYLVESEII